MTRSKAEDFIGTTFNNGNLEVIELLEKGKRTKYKVICKICSPDLELFPQGYFISYKYVLERGSLPCGCSSKPEWEAFQWLVRANRMAETGKFIVHGFAENFHGYSTKLDCECLIDKYKWSPTVDNIVSGKSGCPKCAGVVSPTEQEAFDICSKICEKEGYEFLGFDEGYIGAIKTKIKYKCNIHGEQFVTYNKFVNSGNRCKGCSKCGYNPNKAGSFYIVKWTKDDHNFIKFGITNQTILSRIKQQSRVTEYNYEVLFQQTWEDGHIADDLERSIKRSKLFDIGIIESCKFNDGFTETIDEIYLSSLKDYVNTFIESANNK